VSRGSRTTPGRLAARLLADRRVRFVTVGAGSACIEFGIFQGSIALGAPAPGANVLSFTGVLFISFFGNRLWSFAGDQVLPWRTQFAAYLTLALINVTITTGVIHLAVSAGVAPWAAKLGCMLMVTVWNYLLLNRVVFGRISGADTAPHRSDDRKGAR